jgi:CheY-like chemotaxis protein
MTRISLINASNAQTHDHLSLLAEAGYSVDSIERMTRPQMLAIREQPPAAFIIDLSRVPSDGQSFAIWLRQQKNTRRVPIIFVSGAAEKVARARELLPDIPAVEWEDILPVLHDALSSPIENPVVPGTFDSYSGTPLPKKLGIKSGTLVALLYAPADFEQVLLPLPENARLLTGIPNNQEASIILLFCRSMADLAQNFTAAGSAMAKGGRLWIVWPKRASGIQSDISEGSVRAFGLDAGFVDYKISAIDQTWSGLCFARRQPGKTG